MSAARCCSWNTAVSASCCHVGMSFDSLAELQADETLPPLTALLLADSGYAQLNPAGWIDFLDPQLVILSVSADNYSGLPDQETLEAVGERTLLRTDINGWIEIASDGQSIWVEVEYTTPQVPTPSTPAETLEPMTTESPVPTEEPFGTEPPISTEEPFGTEPPVPTDEPVGTEPPIPPAPP